MAICLRIRRAGSFDAATPAVAGSVTLSADERHVRRRRLNVNTGEAILLDLGEATMLEAGDALELDDGRLIEVIAANEPLMEVRPGAAISVAQLAWHIGNRHLPAQVEAERILIERDHVIRQMLVGLGAEVVDVVEPFLPLKGAYHAGGHSHGHDHGHSHDGHDHGHAHSHHHD